MINAENQLDLIDENKKIEIIKENIMQNVLQIYTLILERLRQIDEKTDLTEEDKFLLLAEIVNPLETSSR
jgi:uncharacterized protein YpiB (UPF0302 family)